VDGAAAQHDPLRGRRLGEGETQAKKKQSATTHGNTSIVTLARRTAGDGTKQFTTESTESTEKNQIVLRALGVLCGEKSLLPLFSASVR
jgi:hypothetical protein